MRDLSELKLKRLKNTIETPMGTLLYEAVFQIPSPVDGINMIAICSTKRGWDHVSVSRPDDKLPTWTELEHVKRLLFRPYEMAIQYHVPERDHVSIGEVLHLWRPQHHGVPRPPKEMV